MKTLITIPLNIVLLIILVLVFSLPLLVSLNLIPSVMNTKTNQVLGISDIRNMK